MTALDRLTTEQAAEVLGINPRTVERAAARRAWPIAADGTYARADITAEALSRARQVAKSTRITTANADGFTRAGAEKLARRIREYWQRRGRIVRVWIEPGEVYSNVLRSGTWWTVRSDMINGWPKK